MKIKILPNIAFACLRFEVVSDEKRCIVVGVVSDAGFIVHLFHWQLIAGCNITAFNEAGKIPQGIYRVAIFNERGKQIYLTTLIKNTEYTEVG